jgi:triosephosphate isomerase
VFVLPPFPLIEPVARVLSGGPVRVGAQNVHWEDSGPFTGEVSAPMLVEVGATIAEIGHSERRQLFGETDKMVRDKVAAAQRHGITPLVCVGEPESVRASGDAAEFVAAQVRAALAGARPDAELWLAYEPVWAIGDQGRPATPEQADDMHAVIRGAAVDALGTAEADVPVLYGGSVDADNAAGFMAAPSVSGLFVGRAAWTADGLLAVASVVARERGLRRTGS